jgi:tetratricopeptide (TPR) repeat protein
MLIKISKTRILIFSIIIASMIYSGFYLLVNPDNTLMRMFRGKISDVDSNIIIGPYPTEADFKRLKNNQVKMIISLLNTDLPYEKILLEKETSLADEYQIKLKNYPMISILGYKMGADYESNAKSAANAAINGGGKVYLHCYLGLHRVEIVKKIIAQEHQQVSNYLLRAGERGEPARMQDQAEQLYAEGKYVQTKDLIKLLPENEQTVLLDAWASYRLNDLTGARMLFNKTLVHISTAEESKIGLAFCNLKSNQLDAALEEFSSIIEANPNNESAYTGAGLTLFRKSKFNEAKTFLNKALELNPHDNDASDTLKKVNQIIQLQQNN